MFKSNFIGDKWEFAKIIMALFCFLLMIYQIIAGINMMNSNNNQPPLIAQSDFDSLNLNQEIRGEITKIAGTFEGDSVNNDVGVCYYFLLTDTNKIVVIRTSSGSEVNQEIEHLRNGEIDSVLFRGYVRPLTDGNKGALNMHLIGTNYLKNNRIEGGTQDAITGKMIDITKYDDTISQRAIDTTFVSAVLLFIVMLLLLRKTFKNALLSVLINKGKINDKQLLEKDDYIFENEGMYTGNEKLKKDFFVNTDYNLRDEGALEQVPEESLTQMVADGDLFYEGGLNEDGNFYVDSTKDPLADVDYYDPDNLTKRY